eukprot:TRINITY_DN5722_c0_g1_i1.p1 TRINITY_DN5722_c0_g1~~TRINITY_DN5722_c0_g1_i1.p1  ORF type:complete len:252 (-),score=55.49 TRINITY_DN5722_c0_g1_i1:463-1128(-)
MGLGSSRSSPPSPSRIIPDDVRVILLGDLGSGKTSMAIRFSKNIFPSEEMADPTIEDTYRQAITVNDQRITFDILDTAGGEECSSMREEYHQSCLGYMILFSITDRVTFESVHSCFKEISQKKRCISSPSPSSPSCPSSSSSPSPFPATVLIGTKYDLIQERTVSTNEAQDVSSRYDVPYVEISSLQSYNVQHAFEELVKQMKQVEIRKQVREVSQVMLKH